MAMGTVIARVRQAINTDNEIFFEFLIGLSLFQ